MEESLPGKRVRLSETKWLSEELLARLRGCSPCHHKSGESSRLVTLLTEPSLSFLCKRFAKFCKEMYEKVARLG